MLKLISSIGVIKIGTWKFKKKMFNFYLLILCNCTVPMRMCIIDFLQYIFESLNIFFYITLIQSNYNTICILIYSNSLILNHPAEVVCRMTTRQYTRVMRITLCLSILAGLWSIFAFVTLLSVSIYMVWLQHQIETAKELNDRSGRKKIKHDLTAYFTRRSCSTDVSKKSHSYIYIRHKNIRGR